MPTVITQVLPYTKKGYDFIVVSTPARKNKVFHSHNAADELVYVIRGSIDVTIARDSEEIVSTINKGEAFFLKRGEMHAVTCEKSASYLIVAKPPIFISLSCFFSKMAKLFRNKKHTAANQLTKK